MAVIHKIILTVGFLSLFHSAYSAAQLLCAPICVLYLTAVEIVPEKTMLYRSYLRLNEMDFKRLPGDIFVQALISLFVIMYGVLNVAGELKEIRASADLDNKSWETFKNVSSFYSFCHRGRSLAG